MKLLKSRNFDGHPMFGIVVVIVIKICKYVSIIFINPMHLGNFFKIFVPVLSFFGLLLTSAKITISVSGTATEEAMTANATPMLVPPGQAIHLLPSGT